MKNRRIEELSPATIPAVNKMLLRPGQEEFLAPVSYGLASAVVDPGTFWQRVVLEGNRVVAFISASFDPDAVRGEFRSVLWRINVEADDQNRGIGRFAIEHLLEEAHRRGFDYVNVIYEAGDAGPEQFFQAMGFEPIGETEYGEVVAQIRINE
ncbi:MAG: GNAT family N-acetyltransferase [Leucobacter sp.]